MAKLGFLRRLIKEDFNKKDQDLVSKIASILNPFMDSMNNSLTNQLTIADNMSAQVTMLTVTVDANGIPTVPLNIKYTLNSTAKQLWITNSQNLTNSAVFMTGAPFLEWTQNGSQIIVNHITGLPANNQYSLTVTIMN
jgi:uncharacterized protein with ParB-like and HNH nuclease domain